MPSKLEDSSSRFFMYFENAPNDYIEYEDSDYDVSESISAITT